MYVTTQEKLQFTRGNGEQKVHQLKTNVSAVLKRFFKTIVKSKKLKTENSVEIYFCVSGL